MLSGAEKAEINVSVEAANLERSSWSGHTWASVKAGGDAMRSTFDTTKTGLKEKSNIRYELDRRRYNTDLWVRGGRYILIKDLLKIKPCRERHERQ